MDRTLLYTVQRVLEKLNLDPVNSINDTEDAMLVAREAESTFYDLMTRAEWKDKEDLIEVESVSDLDNPTMLHLGGEVHKITSFRYDVTSDTDENKVIRRLIWLDPEEFLKRSYTLNTSMDNVQESNYKDIPIFIRNDKAPEYYTSFDNEYLVLDSYDSAVEDMVQGDKAICYGTVVPEWTEYDEFVIPIQDSLYPLYLAMLASACSIYLNSEISQEDERRQARGISRMRREQVRTELETFPRMRFGRKGDGVS